MDVVAKALRNLCKVLSSVSTQCRRLTAVRWWLWCYLAACVWQSAADRHFWAAFYGEQFLTAQYEVSSCVHTEVRDSTHAPSQRHMSGPTYQERVHVPKEHTEGQSKGYLYRMLTCPISCYRQESRQKRPFLVIWCLKIWLFLHAQGPKTAPKLPICHNFGPFFGKFQRSLHTTGHKEPTAFGLILHAHDILKHFEVIFWEFWVSHQFYAEFCATQTAQHSSSSNAIALHEWALLQNCHPQVHGTYTSRSTSKDTTVQNCIVEC